MNDIIQTDHAPFPVGPYQQAVRVGQTIYVSGQIALDLATGQLCSEAIEAQLHQVFAHLSAICVAAGGTLASIVKLGVYLTDLQQATLLNTVMTHYFTAPYPARTTVEVSALPRGAQVEIDAIVMVP